LVEAAPLIGFDLDGASVWVCSDADPGMVTAIIRALKALPQNRTPKRTGTGPRAPSPFERRVSALRASISRAGAQHD
jgi:hypothetical protein